MRLRGGLIARFLAWRGARARAQIKALRLRNYQESRRQASGVSGPVVDLSELQWDKIVTEARRTRARCHGAWIIEPFGCWLCDPDDTSWSWC